MPKTIGSTFGDELLEAGLGDGISFVIGGTDDQIFGRDQLSQADQTALDAVIAAHDHTTGDAAAIIEAICDHAEHLIREGILLEGTPFRGDRESRQRLKESIESLQKGLIPEAKFMTSAGIMYSVNQVAVLDALRDVIMQYGAQVLAFSADSQLSPPAAASDVPGLAWPARPNITIAEITPPA